MTKKHKKVPSTKFECDGHEIKLSGFHEEEYIFKLIKDLNEFYEHDLLDLISKIPLESGSIVDVGANIGNHTVYFSKIMNRKTHAFEISSELLKILEINIKDNKLSKLVSIHGYGLYSRNTKCSISVNYENMGQTHVISVGSDETNAIELKRLDDVISDDENISLLKIDVEGVELEVLLGANNVLSRNKPICFVEIHGPDKIRPLAEYFHEHDYRPVCIMGRSDTWLFAHEKKLDFIGSYIDAVTQRRREKIFASNQSRLKLIQGIFQRGESKSKLELQNMTGLRDRAEEQLQNLRAASDGRSALLEEARAASVEHKAERDEARQETASTQKELGKLTGLRDQAMQKMAAMQSEILAREMSSKCLYEISYQLYLTNDKQTRALAAAKQRPKPPAPAPAKAVVETPQVKQSLPPKKKVTKPTLKKKVKGSAASIANALARNDLIRTFVRRTIPPTLKRKITGKIFDIPPVAAPQPPKPIVVEKTVAKSPPADLVPETAEYDSVILCNSYPGGARVYGGEFIRSRAEAYASQGHSSLIIEVSGLNKEPTFKKAGQLDCLRINPAGLTYFLNKLNKRTANVLTHSPSPETFKILSNEIDSTRCFHWFHGFEVSDYRRRFFNYTTSRLESLREKLDTINRQRMAAARECFADKNSTKIFVSNFIKSLAENDVGQKVENAHIIPNFIDGDYYGFLEKSPEDANRILLIRTFHDRKYANDIAVDAIKLLSERPGFENMRFTIRGFGTYFRPLTEQLEPFPNVDIREGHLFPPEMQKLHSEHGIFLVPTRFDTQGVGMGEAMASGLACITNNTTAIPEYTDASSGVLVRPDDPKAYAEAIWELYTNPEKLPTMSKAAAERVRRQCGFDQTIGRELALFS